MARIKRAMPDVVLPIAALLRTAFARLEPSRALPDHDALYIGKFIGSDALLLLVVMLVLAVAVMVAIFFTVKQEVRFAANLARDRADQLQDILRTVSMAENIAGIGVWQYDPASGAQQWSRGLRRLFGINHNEPFVEGDAETLLFANNVDLIGSVTERLDRDESYNLHFDIFGFDGVSRSLCIQACNLRRRNGTLYRVVAVVRDITEQLERERELEVSRAEAMQEASRAIELASTDQLTGLANRRRVMERLDRMVVDARQSSCPLVLIMFDIDHFKHVNDTYGHIQGDKVLQNVANIAQQQSRTGDIVGRVGGEEFVWIVPNASRGIARVMCERLRLAIATGSATETVPAVTISAGYADLRAGDSALSLFARADSALYEAKNAGRNRVRMAA
ncbi:sensor domain-containing diguanylate cyclase [Erythrobacter insulae]|uniref:diguanylate cyclase n=1 Tax=Erythrobacter insulae TaxID=2584124 RepID=A0A547PDZ6_9SPHN|nr:sensor domain-containing diguanylate cyclase [Erythrobacter insulae]TRD12274.1 sensor domain-containing diguanylate cyclase [Erythrobacter insulae]